MQIKGVFSVCRRSLHHFKVFYSSVIPS